MSHRFAQCLIVFRFSRFLLFIIIVRIIKLNNSNYDEYYKKVRLNKNVTLSFLSSNDLWKCEKPFTKLSPDTSPVGMQPLLTRVYRHWEKIDLIWGDDKVQCYDVFSVHYSSLQPDWKAQVSEAIFNSGTFKPYKIHRNANLTWLCDAKHRNKMKDKNCPQSFCSVGSLMLCENVNTTVDILNVSVISCTDLVLTEVFSWM